MASIAFVAQDGCSTDDGAAAGDDGDGGCEDGPGSGGSSVVELADVAVDPLEELSERSVRQTPGKQTTEWDSNFPIQTH